MADGVRLAQSSACVRISQTQVNLKVTGEGCGSQFRKAVCVPVSLALPDDA